MEANLSVQEKDKMADEFPSPINLMAKIEQAIFRKKKKNYIIPTKPLQKKMARKNNDQKKKFLRAKNPPPLPKCKDGPLFLWRGEEGL